LVLGKNTYKPCAGYYYMPSRAQCRDTLTFNALLKRLFIFALLSSYPSSI
jgi:hypothetical protein